MSYFCFHHSTTRTFNQKFVDLFGEPRDPDWLFFTERSGFPPVITSYSIHYTKLYETTS